MGKVGIRGVSFDSITMNELIEDVTAICIGNLKKLPKILSLANPEILLEAERNFELMSYMRSLDYCVADGVGVLWIAKAMGNSLPERITGTDFLPRLMSASESAGFSVYFLGGQPGIAKTAADHLLAIYPKANVCGVHHGYFKDNDVSNIIDEINSANPDCLMVCLGFPRQELFIKENLGKFQAKLIFGNGGALDFWSGKRKRAPKFLIDMNLEWLWRLLQDFNWKRISRQIKLVRFVVYIVAEYARRFISRCSSK